MNEYIAQTLARQLLEDTARKVRAAHQVSSPEPSSGLPRFRWHVVRHPELARI